MSAFDTSHKLAIFTGSNMAAVLETTELGGLGHTLVNGLRPFVSGGAATVTVGLKTRDKQTDSEVLVGPNGIDFDGMAHFVKSARYNRAQVNISAGSSWLHAQGVEVDAGQGSII